jgi:hypothetical protein
VIDIGGSDDIQRDARGLRTRRRGCAHADRDDEPNYAERARGAH